MEQDMPACLGLVNWMPPEMTTDEPFATLEPQEGPLFLENRLDTIRQLATKHNPEITVPAPITSTWNFVGVVAILERCSIIRDITLLEPFNSFR